MCLYRMYTIVYGHWLEVADRIATVRIRDACSELRAGKDFINECLNIDDGLRQHCRPVKARMIDQHLSRIGLRALSIHVGKVGTQIIQFCPKGLLLGAETPEHRLCRSFRAAHVIVL